jgi:hypothetical protein
VLSVLHPRHKLEYFRNSGWDHTWVDTARDLVRNKFNSKYASREVSDGGNGSTAAVAQAPEEASKVRGMFYKPRVL